MENPFSETELRWLWEPVRRCTFTPGTYAKRFARNNDFEHLTIPKGRNMAAQFGFTYRRQIFTGRGIAKWTHEQFTSAVQRAAADQIRRGEWTPPLVLNSKALPL